MLKINPFINNYVKPKMHQILGIGTVATLALLQGGCNTHDFEDLGIVPKKDTISVQPDKTTRKDSMSVKIDTTTRKYSIDVIV